MTGTQLFAFVILPVVVAGLGWSIALLHDRANRRGGHGHHHGPAE